MTDSKDTAATSLAEFQLPPFSMSASMINGRRFVLFTSEYYPVPMPKDLIILHFLAGADAASAFGTWHSNPAHVATAYLVDTDGTINEPFHAPYWAYHLGVKGTKGLQDKRSVGVEIVNVRPLKLSPTATTSLNWRPPANRGEKTWCQTTEAERYLKVPYWGIEYSTAFPNSQVDAVAQLVLYVSEFLESTRLFPRRAAGKSMTWTTSVSIGALAHTKNFVGTNGM
jgi:N-acetyl-anhydromuramyl-L-alanine amidase AmpD